jgi:hypothetical protein
MVDAPRERSGEDGDDDVTGIVREDDGITTERAGWYDPEEFTMMEKEARRGWREASVVWDQFGGGPFICWTSSDWFSLKNSRAVGPAVGM